MFFLAAAESTGQTPIVHPAAPILFHVGPLPITASIVQSWVILLLLFLIIRLGASRLQMVPTGLQNAIEAAVEGLERLTRGLLEPKVADWAFPLVATYFIFIATSNLTGLIPGVGTIGYGEPNPNFPLPFSIHHPHISLLRPPTSDANMTCAMAAIYFVISLFWAIRYHRGPWGLLVHIFGVKGGMKGWILIPLAVLFFAVGLMEALSIVIRAIALAMRLYGNIYGGESVLVLMTGMFGGLAAVPFYFFEFAVALIQALIFTLLAIVFTGTLCSHSEEPHK
ncbi:F-type H+-transporting ATPase subunit a [Methylacidimicrobium cyclopophantes]|uniref:ATP synthase subunit a n=1 Tax=Methylacidimicrobium cyclopophantes TaxID=1041766 RepID=A0A5E6ME79_9BACT|nr:FoF1 ATP synthase subunit a [Methylacidimicrobium cyclopophantes]VVM06656.1 F-type H+-transporting ATPase subunit a [Methylacidimicrobium cyclopophantes]